MHSSFPFKAFAAHAEQHIDVQSKLIKTLDYILHPYLEDIFLADRNYAPQPKMFVSSLSACLFPQLWNVSSHKYSTKKL